MRFYKSKSFKVFIIILLLLIAFFLRLFPLRIAHFWDETVYLQNAETIFSDRHNYDEFSFRPPLISIIFAGLFFIWHSPIIASISVALICTLSSLFLYLIGKKIYNEKIGIVAGLMMAFLPFIVLNSNYILTDVPVVTFMAASFYFSLFEEKRPLIFLSGIFLAFSILVKFTAVLFIFVFLLFFILKKFNFKKIVLFFSGLILVLFPYLLWCQIKFGNFLTPFLQGNIMVTDLNEGVSFYFLHLGAVFNWIFLLGLILWLIGAIIQIKRGKYSSMRYDLTFVFWIILFLAYLTSVPHKELRYLFPISIPVLLLASSGFIYFYEKLKISFRRLAILILVVFVISLIWSTYGLTNIREGKFIVSQPSEEMKVSDFLMNQMNYTGIVYSNQRWPIFAYYTGLETRQVYPYSEEIYSILPKAMKDPGVFIGQYDAERFAPFKHPNSTWLNKDPRFTHIKDIGNFYLYKYDPKGFH